jgi:hypothetical protein
MSFMAELPAAVCNMQQREGEGGGRYKEKVVR